MYFGHQTRKLQENLVHITPSPVFAGLERLHDRVLGVVEMLGGMLVLRTVAAAYMATFQAQAQVDPGVTHFKTLLASFAAGRHLLSRFHVRTSWLAHSGSSDLL